MKVLALLCCLSLAHVVGAQDIFPDAPEFEDHDSTAGDSELIGEDWSGPDSSDISWAEHLAASPPASEVISDSTWEALTDDRVYDRVDPEQPAPPNEGFEWWSGFLEGLSALAWVLITVLIVAVIAFLVYYNRRDTKVSRRRPGGGLTDELLGASREDIDEGLARNLADGDYRAAIRYRFGQVLQDLRAAHYLRWVPGKTNEDYAAELPDGLRGSFERLAGSFAYAFYSGQSVTEAHYHDFSTEAAALASLLTSASLPQNLAR